jgi:hypothetical protein
MTVFSFLLLAEELKIEQEAFRNAPLWRSLAAKFSSTGMLNRGARNSLTLMNPIEDISNAIVGPRTQNLNGTPSFSLG